MTSHVKVLGALYLVFGALGVLAGIAILLFFGGLAGLAALTGPSTGAFFAIPVLGVLAGIGFFIVMLMSLPGLLAGIGLLQFRGWARILAIVLSAIHLLNIPFGTALGIYGLWVLLSKDTERLFAAAPARA